MEVRIHRKSQVFPNIVHAAAGLSAFLGQRVPPAVQFDEIMGFYLFVCQVAMEDVRASESADVEITHHVALVEFVVFQVVSHLIYEIFAFFVFV